MKFLNLKGEKFNKLTVLRRVINKYNLVHWKCICDCGNIIIVSRGDLKSKHTKSCGCLKIGNPKHNMRFTKFYFSWAGIKDRCGNSNSKYYKNYGGRGITYDPKWENFLGFKKDMYLKYLYAKKQLRIEIPTIERIDVNDNYCFDNCIFIPKSEQPKNTRRSLKNRLPTYTSPPKPYKPERNK